MHTFLMLEQVVHMVATGLWISITENICVLCLKIMQAEDWQLAAPLRPNLFVTASPTALGMHVGINGGEDVV
jgi:hypothetical protein